MASLPLITPSDCAVVLVDYQAGLAFAAGSADRQGIRSAALALAKTAVAFSVPVGGQHVGDQGLQRAADAAAARCPDRRSTDRTPQHEPVGGRSRQGSGRGHGAAHAGRRRPPDGSVRQFSGALRAGGGYRVRVVADACGGLTQDSHWAALQRMQQAGAVLTSWLQVLLEFQRDWTRRETYEAARAIVVEHAGGYGIGLDYARDTIKPA